MGQVAIKILRRESFSLPSDICPTSDLQRMVRTYLICTARYAYPGEAVEFRLIAEDNWPWTGVSVGCSRVNSSSKLLVSALPFYKMVSTGDVKKGALLRWWGHTEEVYAYSRHRQS